MCKVCNLVKEGFTEQMVSKFLIHNDIHVLGSGGCAVNEFHNYIHTVLITFMIAMTVG